MLPPLSLLLAGLAALAAGAINSIAGGGTLVSFPALVALGVPPLAANATNTVSLWPGSIGSLWGYRPALAGMRPWLVRFAMPSALGGLVGAALLLVTGEGVFAAIVPFLVLLATVLFMAQGSVLRWLGRHASLAAPAEARRPGPALLAGQFAVAVYGGYFGAGMGILMLAVFGLMGLVSIHRMNGLKNWCGFLINAAAAVLFAASGVVHWTVAGVMAVGGVAGGYAGARVAQRVGQTTVRRTVVIIGFAAFLWLLTEPL